MFFTDEESQDSESFFLYIPRERKFIGSHGGARCTYTNGNMKVTSIDDNVEIVSTTKYQAISNWCKFCLRVFILVLRNVFLRRSW